MPCLSSFWLVSSFRFEGSKPKWMVKPVGLRLKQLMVIMQSMFCAPVSRATLLASSLPGDHCAESMNIFKFFTISGGSQKQKSLYSYLYPRISLTSRQSPFTPSHLH